MKQSNFARKGVNANWVFSRFFDQFHKRRKGRNSLGNVSTQYRVFASRRGTQCRSHDVSLFWSSLKCQDSYESTNRSGIKTTQTGYESSEFGYESTRYETSVGAERPNGYRSHCSVHLTLTTMKLPWLTLCFFLYPTRILYDRSLQ